MKEKIAQYHATCVAPLAEADSPYWSSTDICNYLTSVDIPFDVEYLEYPLSGEFYPITTGKAVIKFSAYYNDYGLTNSFTAAEVTRAVEFYRTAQNMNEPMAFSSELDDLHNLSKETSVEDLRKYDCVCERSKTDGGSNENC